MQAGSQLSLTARHDTYGISFAWPTSNPETPAEQTIHCSEDMHKASSMPTPPTASAGEGTVANADKLNADGSSRTVDSTGRDVHAATDVCNDKSSISDDSNHGSRQIFDDHDCRSIGTQRGQVTLSCSGAMPAARVPLVVGFPLC